MGKSGRWMAVWFCLSIPKGMGGQEHKESCQSCFNLRPSSSKVLWVFGYGSCKYDDNDDDDDDDNHKSEFICANMRKTKRIVEGREERGKREEASCKRSEVVASRHRKNHM